MPSKSHIKNATDIISKKYQTSRADAAIKYKKLIRQIANREAKRDKYLAYAKFHNIKYKSKSIASLREAIITHKRSLIDAAKNRNYEKAVIKEKQAWQKLGIILQPTPYQLHHFSGLRKEISKIPSYDKEKQLFFLNITSRKLGNKTEYSSKWKQKRAMGAIVEDIVGRISEKEDPISKYQYEFFSSAYDKEILKLLNKRQRAINKEQKNESRLRRMNRNYILRERLNRALGQDEFFWYYFTDNDQDRVIAISKTETKEKRFMTYTEFIEEYLGKPDPEELRRHEEEQAERDREGKEFFYGMLRKTRAQEVLARKKELRFKNEILAAKKEKRRANRKEKEKEQKKKTKRRKK